MTNSTRHHGLALMLVVAVVAMASLIGMAMLSNASLQAQAAGNHERATMANYLAESAAQTAGYYLQRNLAGMPANWGDAAGHTIYAQNVTVSGVEGSFSLDVTPTAVPDVYQIVATGYSGGTTPITRTITSNMKVVRATPTVAAAFGGSSVIGLGNYFSGAPVITLGVLSGGGLINLLGGTRAVLSEDFIVPTVGGGAAPLNYYGADVANGTYTTPSGQVGTAQILSSGTIPSPATLTPLATNPGKIFYYNGNVVITGAGTYTGTILSRGKIEIAVPLGSTVKWFRQTGFPAMVSDGSLLVNSRLLNMTVDGIVFAGKGTYFGTPLATTGSSFKINGSLLIPAGFNVNAGGVASMSVTYTPANSDVQNMTTTPQPAVGLKYLSWAQ